MATLKTQRNLINAGANLNLQDKVGDNSLHTATILNYSEIARMLIDAGANLNLQNNKGQTAEQRAKKPEMRALFAQARQKNDDRTMAIFENQLKKDRR